MVQCMNAAPYWLLEQAPSQSSRETSKGIAEVHLQALVHSLAAACAHGLSFEWFCLTQPYSISILPWEDHRLFATEFWHVSEMLTSACALTGREAPGKTFRLYTEAEFEKLASSTTPEILRVNLAAAVLQLKALGISDIRAFDFVDQPPLPALVRALEHLHVLGALDTNGDLSPCGQQMARLPVDPQYAKILLVAAANGCAEDAAAVVAMASVEQVFVNGRCSLLQVAIPLL